MKKILYIGLSLVLMLGLNSCSDWLDINDNPNTPNNKEGTVATRLAAMQHYYLYAQGAAGSRAAMITGAVTRNVAANNAHNELCAWNPIIGSSTTPYQMWFVGVAANFEDYFKAAEESEAWHYVGAGKIIKAMGYMMMVDWYGEMPFRQASSTNITPEYDSGEYIFNECLKLLDEGIANLEKAQGQYVTPLSKGDGWNNGNVNKWIKMAYGLKARWLNNLSKKSTYNPDAVLDALAKAAQSNAESTIIKHYNKAGDTDTDPFLGDPLQTSIAYDNIGMNTYFFATKWYMDLFGTTDPRLDKMVPSRQFKKADGTLELVRTKPVDMITSDIRLKDGPLLAAYAEPKGEEGKGKRWFINSTNSARLADTLYVVMRSEGAMYKVLPNGDDTSRDADGRVMSTGTFYTRADAPTPLMSYHELCFIKAEVLYRKGDAGAVQAYKDGIKAHMDMMNQTLSGYAAVADNPSKKPMAAADINAFLAGPEVAQTMGDLTMAKIMQQKYIACSYSQQNWNDMRRFNYSAGNIGSFGVVYPGYDRPYEFGNNATAGSKMIGATKTDPRYWFRRMSQSTHEVNYNSENLRASNPEAFATSVWSVPVWWDQE